MGRLEPNHDAVRVAYEETSESAGDACVITVPAVAGKLHVLEDLEFSYDDAPAALSTIKVTSGGETLLDQYITAGGVGQFQWGEHGRHGSESARGSSLIITLSASASRKGKLNAGVR
jgi:hypothetical protein